MLRGWGDLYRLSLSLGFRGLRDPVSRHEALIRLAAPLEDTRLLELPHVRRALEPMPGEKLLDLASPKLLAVALGRSGASVESVDLLASEVETWRALAGRRPGVEFSVADGTRLPHADASFDGAFSVSVLEHIPEGGDGLALAELGRIVRSGGRVVITLPYGEAGESWQSAPMYSDESGSEAPRHFYARTYSTETLHGLVEQAPTLRLDEMSAYSFAPSRLYSLYARNLPRSAPLAHLLPYVLSERSGGGVAQLKLRRV